jgi:hypothetical protein
MKSLYTILSSAMIFLAVSADAAGIVENAPKKIYFGMHYGIGLTSPDDINRYLVDYYLEEGFEEKDIDEIELMLADFDAHLSFFAVPFLELKLAYSFSCAYSKVQDVDMLGLDNDRLNLYLKWGPYAVVNYHFRITESRSVYIGAGPAWNDLYLNYNDKETYTGNGLGWRLNIGYLVREGAIPVFGEIEVQLMGTDAKPEENGYHGDYTIDPLKKLTFSGICIKFGFNI